jgi:hypothetical protein
LENPDKFKLARNDLIPVIKKRERDLRAENDKYTKTSKTVKGDSTLSGEYSYR